MYKQKLTLCLSSSFEIPETEQVSLFKKVGFEGFSIDYSAKNSPVEELVRIGREEEMIIPSFHAPFNKSGDMWNPATIGDDAMEEMLDMLEICARYEIPIIVTHAFIGMEPDEELISVQTGIERYGAVAKRATELGIRFALENTEGEQYLGILLDNLRSEESVGFCWDTGHELCYNHGTDMMSLYGDRLILTHLNDNLGIRDYEGKITWHDDLHLLPFDGITDWESVAKRLAENKFDGPLNFELSRFGKPDRLDNEMYKELAPQRYITAAYARACRVAALKASYERK
ncbi:MAG: sugar phosphate isomerase/epimerase [Clostridia bacterium]|nr:sugar phosphate isomerase/epimerase [Clostridia bacterium]